MNLKELLKQRVDNEDLLPDLPQENKDKNTEIVKAYKEGYEQGKKDAEQQQQITSEIDETFRIASEIRIAVGCNTSHECWELARKGDIQRVKHGQWIHRPVEEWGASNCKCSLCGTEYFFPLLLKEGADNYCGNCGAKMEK